MVRGKGFGYVAVEQSYPFLDSVTEPSGDFLRVVGRSVEDQRQEEQHQGGKNADRAAVFSYVKVRLHCLMSFVMVRLASDDGKSPVQLFREDNPHHLVRKCHFRQGYRAVAAVIHLPGEAVCPSDDEHHVPAGAGDASLQCPCPFHR